MDRRLLKANENFWIIMHISTERDLLLDTARGGELRASVLSLKTLMNLPDTV